jgi:tyrosine-protein phosphatase
MIELKPVPKSKPSMELRLEAPFSPTSTSFFKAPLSPGFGAHRFGGIQHAGFSSLNAASFGQIAGPTSQSAGDKEVTMAPSLPDNDALMSPRAETMTNNPLHDSFSEMAGMKFVEQPPTPADSLFSPRQTLFPREALQPFGRPTQMTDPRSPPTKGEAPITRSIDDLI